MTNLRKLPPLLLLLALTACGAEAVDESRHGGAPIPDSTNFGQDSLPNPDVPAVLEAPLAS